MARLIRFGIFSAGMTALEAVQCGRGKQSGGVAVLHLVVTLSAYVLFELACVHMGWIE